eukprot:SAG31_NODE_152_length_22216_cov_16.550029_2_plen_610_part_00
MNDPSKLQLQGLGIAEAHCEIEYSVTEAGHSAVRIIPLQDGKTFVNGLELSVPIQLTHGNRVIFGTGNFFRYADPQEAARNMADRPTTAPAELVAELGQAADWEFAQAERLQAVMAESNQKTDAAKAALEAAKQELAAQEKKLAMEQAKKEAELAAQQADYEAKVAELNAGGKAAASQLKEYEAKMAEQAAEFERKMAHKEADLAQKRAELRLSEVAERQQALLEDKLVRVIPLVEEANLMATELKRNTVFEVKVVSKLHQNGGGDKVSSADAFTADMTQLQASVQVKVTYLKEDRDLMWDPDKFQNRIFLMREFYASAQEDQSFLRDVSEVDDPFFDPAEAQLIGVGHIYLEALAYLLDIKQSTPVVDYKGNKVASLTVDIAPCAPDGMPLGEGEGMMVETPEDLVGKRMDLLVSVLGVSGLGRPHSKQGCYVRHKFYLDEDGGPDEAVRQSRTSVPSENPVFDYTRHISIDPISESFVQYLKDGNMTFQLVSQPHSDTAVTAAEQCDADAVVSDVAVAPQSGSELPSVSGSGARADSAAETPRETRLERKLGQMEIEIVAAREETEKLVKEVARHKTVAKKYEVECAELRGLLEQKTKAQSKACTIL